MTRHFSDDFPHVANELAARERELAAAEQAEQIRERLRLDRSATDFRQEIMRRVAGHYENAQPAYAERESAMRELLPVMRRLVEAQHRVNQVEMQARTEAGRLGLDSWELEPFLERYRSGLPQWRALSRGPANGVERVMWPALAVLLQSDCGESSG